MYFLLLTQHFLWCPGAKFFCAAMSCLCWLRLAVLWSPLMMLVMMLSCHGGALWSGRTWYPPLVILFFLVVATNVYVMFVGGCCSSCAALSSFHHVRVVPSMVLYCSCLLRMSQPLVTRRVLHTLFCGKYRSFPGSCPQLHDDMISYTSVTSSFCYICIVMSSNRWGLSSRIRSLRICDLCLGCVCGRVPDVPQQWLIAAIAWFQNSFFSCCSVAAAGWCRQHGWQCPCHFFKSFFLIALGCPRVSLLSVSWGNFSIMMMIL